MLRTILYTGLTFLFLRSLSYCELPEKTTVKFFRDGIACLDSTLKRRDATYKISRYNQAAQKIETLINLNKRFYEGYNTFLKFDSLKYEDKQRIALAPFYLRKAYFKIGWHNEYNDVKRNINEAKKYYRKAKEYPIDTRNHLSRLKDDEYYENLYLNAWISFKVADLETGNFNDAKDEFKTCYDSLEGKDDLKDLRDESQFMYYYSWFRFLENERLNRHQNHIKNSGDYKRILENFNEIGSAGSGILNQLARVMTGEIFYQMGKLAQAIPDSIFTSEQLKEIIAEILPQKEYNKEEFEFACFNTAKMIFEEMKSLNDPKLSVICNYGDLMLRLNLGSIQTGSDFHDEIYAIVENNLFGKLITEKENLKYLSFDSTSFNNEIELRDADYNLILAYQEYANEDEYQKNLDLALGKYNKIIRSEIKNYDNEALFWLAWIYFQNGQYEEAKTKFNEFVKSVGDEPKGVEKLMTDWAYYMRAECSFQIELQKRGGDVSTTTTEFENLPLFIKEVELRKYMKQVIFKTVLVSQYLEGTKTVENLELLVREILQVAVRARGRQRQSFLEMAEEVYEGILRKSIGVEDKAKANLILASILTYQVETLLNLGGRDNKEKANEKFREAEVRLRLCKRKPLTKYEAMNVEGHLYAAKGEEELDEAIRIFKENMRHGDYRAPTLLANLEREKLRGELIGIDKKREIADAYQIAMNSLRQDKRNYWYIQADEGQKAIELRGDTKETLNEDEMKKFEENRKELGFSYEELTSEAYLRKSTAELAINLWRLYTLPKRFLQPEFFIEVLPEDSITTAEFVMLSAETKERISERGGVNFFDESGAASPPVKIDSITHKYDVKRKPQEVNFSFTGYYPNSKYYDFTIPQPLDTIYLQPPAEFENPKTVASPEYPTDFNTKRGLITDKGYILKKNGERFNKEYILYFPTGIAVLSDKVYVVDSRNNQIEIFDTTGAHLKSFGKGDLSRPTDIEIYDSKVYIVDSDNNRIVGYDTAGVYEDEFGVDILNSPEAIAIDRSGNVFVTDLGTHQVVKFDSDGNLIDSFGKFGDDYGEFQFPTRIALEEDPENKRELYIYVADRNRVQKFDSNGNFLQLIHEYKSPYGIVMQGYGLNNPELYVAERGKNRDGKNHIIKLKGEWYEGYKHELPKQK